jgi:hypothetical protein
MAMAYGEGLAERILGCIPAGATSRKMFGGICYLINGNMASRIVGDRLMLRRSKELVAEYRKEPETADIDFTGRPRA